MRKWMYNPKAETITNMDTGSQFCTYVDYSDFAQYEASVVFQGAFVGLVEGMEVHTVKEVLFSGTQDECKEYLQQFKWHLEVFDIPPGTGTPEPVVEENKREGEHIARDEKQRE